VELFIRTGFGFSLELHFFRCLAKLSSNTVLFKTGDHIKVLTLDLI